MGKYSSGFGPPSNISGVSNHYNRKLSKCIVDMQIADKNGTAEFVMGSPSRSNREGPAEPARKSGNCHRQGTRFQQLIAILAIVAAENQSYNQ
jgi:hypothetical protein